MDILSKINNFLIQRLYSELHSDPEKDKVLTGNIYGLHLLAVTVFLSFFAPMAIMLNYSRFLAVTVFLGFFALFAIILNYSRFFAVKGFWLESHFQYQIQTFWTALFFFIVVILSFFVWNGWLTYAGFIIWYLLRIWKGYAAYRQKKPVIGSWII